MHVCVSVWEGEAKSLRDTFGFEAVRVGDEGGIGGFGMGQSCRKNFRQNIEKQKLIICVCVCEERRMKDYIFGVMKVMKSRAAF